MNIKEKIKILTYKIHNRICKAFIECRSSYIKEKLGLYQKGAALFNPQLCNVPHKIHIYENANIHAGSVFIISPKGDDGKLIFKKNSGASYGLTVITGNHQRKVGTFFKDQSKSHIGDIDKDVIVEEDVWIGANVTLLSGVIVGRGSTIGAGSVCLKSIPPYAVVMGNPAKVVGFNFTPEEIIEHEKALYPEEERLPLELLEKNYNKYFISRIKEIKEFTRLSL